MTHAERAERRRLIAEAVRSGSPVLQVARGFGVSESLVQAACRLHGVPVPGQPRPVSSSTYDILARLWDASLTMRDIGAELGVSFQAVSEVYRKGLEAGIPLPPRPAANVIRPDPEEATP